MYQVYYPESLYVEPEKFRPNSKKRWMAKDGSIERRETPKRKEPAWALGC
jgi:hypothetical protein